MRTFERVLWLVALLLMLATAYYYKVQMDTVFGLAERAVAVGQGLADRLDACEAK